MSLTLWRVRSHQCDVLAGPWSVRSHSCDWNVQCITSSTFRFGAERRCITAIQATKYLFNPSWSIIMCIWSDITGVQDYEMHYMNDWLKICVFNPLTRTITPVWCLGWSLKRTITLVWLERSVHHVINLSLRSRAAVHHCCSPILQVRNSERVWVLQHSSGGRSLTGEKSNSREDSHTRSVRWPSPLRASVLKRANFSKWATRVLNRSYHPCITRVFHDRCLSRVGIQFSLSPGMTTRLHCPLRMW